MTVRRALSGISLIAAGVLVGFGFGRWYGSRMASGTRAVREAPKGYHCPMHPSFRSDKPGECGICGMKLVRDDDPGHSAGMQGEETPKMPMGTIRISPEKQQLIGVAYGEVTAGGGFRTIRASGKVAMDETSVVKVQTRVEGWIDRVFVDFTGKLVQKGQPLLTLYSPEMLASQQEYLLALESREILKSSPLAGSRPDAESLIAASRKRLELWDLSAEQIERITRTRQPLTNITLYAPISGYVMTRNAFPKQRITPETELYTLADLSQVWILADVFESDASVIRTGMPVFMTLSYAGGRRLQGRVNYIQPQVDMTTRTLKVRIDAGNPGLALKPEMFVDVEFPIHTPSRLLAPSEAVLDSGLRKTVFVDRGNGYLEPRQVETGERFGGRVEILRGLRLGERIVTSGAFLIDSESKLKSAASGMAGHQHGGAAKETPASSEPAPRGGHKHD